MFTVPADHPALPGHFPGQPIVPAVVILDELAAHLATMMPQAHISRLISAKFMSPLLPGQVCQVIFTPRASDQLKFACSCEGRDVASGLLEIRVGASA